MMWRRNRGRARYSTWAYQEYLPSRDQGLYFDVHVRFFGAALAAGDQRDEPAEAGADRLRRELEDVTQRYSPVRWQEVRHLLVARLSELLPFWVPGADFREATVVVRVRQEDLQAAMRVEHARHELELDEWAHRQIKARMQFLRQECLRDPAAAELFTLLPPSSRLVGTDPEGDPTRLVELVRKWEPDSGWMRAAKKLMEFGEKLTPEQLVTLGKIGHDVMERFSEPERGRQFAEALRDEAAKGQRSRDDRQSPPDDAPPVDRDGPLAV